MSRKLVAVLCVVLIGSVGAMAQNARLNALGQNPILSDFTNMLYNPAYMSDYKDALQATYDGGVGPLLGVKAVGDVVSLGLTYEQTRVLDNLNPVIYAAAPGLLGFINGVPALAGDIAAADIDPMPHLQLGLDFGVVKAGVDLYWERAFYKYSLDQTIAAVTTVEEGDGNFTNMGFSLGVNLDLDAFFGTLTFGMGLPKINGNWSLEQTGLPTQEGTAESDAGLSMRAGVDGYFTLLDLDWMVGLYAEMLKYKGRYELPPAPAVIGDEYFTGAISLILGFQKKLEERDINLALTETMAMSTDKVTRETPLVPGNVDVAANALGFLTVASIEKQWTDLKRLDVIQGRCAVTYGTDIAIDHQDGSVAADNLADREKFPAGRTGFDLLLGAGVGKGIFQLDAQIDAAAALEAFKLVAGQYNAGGTDIACVTLTLDFGKLSGKSGSSDVESAPAPAPVETPSAAPAF